MIDHEPMRDQLVSFALGELSDVERVAVSAHVSACDRCRAELTRLEKLLACAGRRKDLSADEPQYESARAGLLAVVGGLARPKRSARAKAIWRDVMEKRLVRLAVAAVIVLALLLIVQQLGGPVRGTGLAWGDVRDAFLGQHWAHLKYDNGAEQWYNLQTGDLYLRDWDGRCVAVDHARNIRQIYDSILGQHISENRPVIYKDDVIPPWEPKTAWESVIGPWEQMAEHGGAGDWEVERHPDQVGDAQLIRFDCYLNDAAGRRLLIRQIWADPKTRLPLTVWERLQLADREKQKRESVTGTFDFPETGPASLYDLGVSRDLPVVKYYDKAPVPSVEKIMEAARAALERFPRRYRVVVWDNTRESEIDVIWRDGGQIRSDRYFNLTGERYAPYHLSLPANAQDVWRWTQTQPPISTYLLDGEREYTRHYVHPVFPDSRNEARVMRSQGTDLLPSSSKPMEEQWPYANHSPAGFEVIRDAPEEWSGYIGLRVNSADIRREYYIDPEHDFLCVRWIWWKQRAGQWEKEREYEYSGFTRLAQGQWYAAKRILVTYPDPERGTSRGGANWNIHVELLEEGDFPPDTFNGDKLLEGAKVETY